MLIPVDRSKNLKSRPAIQDYGFGRYFSDHMFVSEFSESQGWQSPRVIPYQNLAVDPGASVLHYGQAIFEGLKAFRGVDGKIRLFRPQMNHQRMHASAERLCMRAPSSELFIEGLKALVTTDADWVPNIPGTSLYLRPTLIGTESFLGVRPSQNYLFYIIASPVSSYYSEGLGSLKIWIERKYSRACPGGIGFAKAGGNYAASLKAAVEAKKQGYAQVLWTDSSQHRLVEEVGTMNVFFVIKDRVVTPALSGTILPGVMRDSVITLLKSWGMPVEERVVELDEILAAQKSGDLSEVFGTGTAAQISPVSVLGTIDDKGHPVQLSVGLKSPGPISNRLYDYFLGLNHAKTPDSFGWLLEVK